MDRKDRNNLLFYLLMTCVCVKLKTPRAGGKAISKLKVSEIEDQILHDSLAIVRQMYEKHGASDNAAKGSEFVADLKELLTETFGKKRKI